MRSNFFHIPDSPDLRAWLDAEKAAVARMDDMAVALRSTDPARAVQLDVIVRRRVAELLDIEEWLDLR
jgi:hypothetical protein